MVFPLSYGTQKCGVPLVLWFHGQISQLCSWSPPHTLKVSEPSCWGSEGPCTPAILTAPPRTCVPGRQESQLCPWVSQHMNPWRGALTAHVLWGDPVCLCPLRGSQAKQLGKRMCLFFRLRFFLVQSAKPWSGIEEAADAPLVLVFAHLSPGSFGGCESRGGRLPSWRSNPPLLQ